MNNFDIDKFLPKFRTREENEKIFFEYNMKLLSLDFDDIALNQMLGDKKISKNEYLKIKNKIAKKRNELKQ